MKGYLLLRSNSLALYLKKFVYLWLDLCTDVPHSLQIDYLSRFCENSTFGIPNTVSSLKYPTVKYKLGFHQSHGFTVGYNKCDDRVMSIMHGARYRVFSSFCSGLSFYFMVNCRARFSGILSTKSFRNWLLKCLEIQWKLAESGFLLCRDSRMSIGATGEREWNVYRSSWNFEKWLIALPSMMAESLRSNRLYLQIFSKAPRSLTVYTTRENSAILWWILLRQRFEIPNFWLHQQLALG